MKLWPIPLVIWGFVFGFLIGLAVAEDRQPACCAKEVTEACARQGTDPDSVDHPVLSPR
jgi:hypothetical protein